MRKKSLIHTFDGESLHMFCIMIAYDVLMTRGFELGVKGQGKH